MLKIIEGLLVGVLLVGCSEQKPFPSARMEQPSGNFSFITPEGWFRKKISGIDFVIVYASEDYGFSPNIFVDFVSQTRSLEDAISRLTRIYERYTDYYVSEKKEFETESSLRGVKIIAHRKTKEKLPLATYQYLIAESNRVFSITCSCVDAVKEKYEPIFDKAMHTLNSN